MRFWKIFGQTLAIVSSIVLIGAILIWALSLGLYVLDVILGCIVLSALVAFIEYFFV